MAVATFNLNNFRASVLGSEGLARTNRFEVLINAPTALSSSYSRLSSLYVEQASLPLLNIFSKSFKIFGPAYQRPITSEYGGEGIPITFHVDRRMQVRKFFEDWMHLIVDPDNFTVGYQKDYIGNIRVRQLDEANNVTHEIELIEAFPRNINLMDLNHSSSNQTHRLNVLFAYRYWRNVERVTKNITDIPQLIVNPQVPREDVRITSGLTAEQANEARATFAATDPRRVDIN